MPEVSIAVCTWNRAARLRRLLESLPLQRLDGVTWEVVVLATCGTDSTDDVVVGPGWVQAYATAIRRFPGASVFGGRRVAGAFVHGSIVSERLHDGVLALVERVPSPTNVDHVSLSRLASENIGPTAAFLLEVSALGAVSNGDGTVWREDLPLLED